ncbi:MAG TPA: FMN-dependent NADH-azoreductase [Caulobacteraceae bacterium]
MKLLHIDSSILGANSVSRQVSAAIVERLRAATPDLEVIYRDLAAAPPSHLTGGQFAARFGAAPEDAEDQAQVAAGEAVLAEFLAADIIVIGAPMYNFTLPTQLKAWVDRIVIAGKTFRYGANGPEGLAGGKRVIIALSRGGLYGQGAPAEAFEHVEGYLRSIFAFMGIANPQFIVAEGIQIGPDQRAQALDKALRAAGELQAA